MGNSGCILPFFYGKNSKLNFKNIKKYENYWKHKYDNIYVEKFFFLKWNHILFYLLATIRILIMVIYLAEKSDTKFYT